MAFSPEAGLKISTTVVVVTAVTVVVVLAATLALVESDEADNPPHAARNKRASGTKRFNMIFSA